MSVKGKRLIPELDQGDIDRFWSKVNKDAQGGCWQWTGGVTSWGYGQFHILMNGKRTNHRAHRVCWFLEHGTLGQESVLDHICRNRLCVNPDHLRELSNAQNVLAGVGITAVNARKSSCKNGHPFDAENTRIRSGGDRRCRACEREWDRSRPRYSMRVTCEQCGISLLHDSVRKHARRKHSKNGVRDE